MNLKIGEFAEELKISKEELKEISRQLNLLRIVYSEEEQKMIKNYIKNLENIKVNNEEINTQIIELNENIDCKREELKNLEEEIESKKLKFNDFINNEKQKLETERNTLKSNLVTEELNHKTKLEEEKIKILVKLKDEFLENIKSEYNNINIKLDEITKKELKLIEWSQHLDLKEKTFDKEKEIFELQKDKLLVKYKEELEQNKEIFLNKQEEEKLKKLEEFNKSIEESYKEKEFEYKTKKEELLKKEVELNIKETEITYKEKSIDSLRDSLYINEKNKVEMEIKVYQQRLENNENLINQLNEEVLDLREQLNEVEQFENRDLPREIEESRNEIIRLRNTINDEIKQKNELKIQIAKDSKENSDKLKQFFIENRDLRDENMAIESLKTENTILKDKENSNLEYIEILKGEKRRLEENLNSIYSQGKELELREEDIKRVPYLKRKLEEELNENNEIKYLNNIAENMKEYGVEYPKRLLYSFHTALKSSDFSPLVVLSGVSGTGKSELPKLYSHFGGFNFLAEAVQPTWDSPESMMGYYNTIENKFDSTNILKFLIQTTQSKNDKQFGFKESMNMILLDEMNLSHIELYFAEFLSKFEQRRGSKNINLDIKLGAGMNMPLPLDRNTLWIGTMNEDETTKSLSDKVLDRSFAINFPRPDELRSRTKIKTLEEIKEFEYLNRDIWNSWLQKDTIFTSDNVELINKYKNITNQINKKLSETGKAIGHRVWQSMEFYIQNHPLVINNLKDDSELAKNVKLAFEEQLVQKVMPKLRGIETHGKEKDVLKDIETILNTEELRITEDFELSMSNPYGQFIWNSANYLKEY
jgi:hypothetical protein